MVLDPVDRLLFVANEGNAMLLTVDLESMRVLDKQRVGQDPDVLAYDPRWGRLYVAAWWRRPPIWEAWQEPLMAQCRWPGSRYRRPLAAHRAWCPCSPYETGDRCTTVTRPYLTPTQSLSIRERTSSIFRSRASVAIR